ncbi:hypothetical protein PR048_009661 [Dryococelus australis]|uniref:Uncharacterized protein n=1 Tax=Dryococelus australis TaxID=614101 RepID=A0ABQ9I1H3_9NEOP|nr:hypothetical protein PR048_009661 [Dryococelus australis]
MALANLIRAFSRRPTGYFVNPTAEAEEYPGSKTSAGLQKTPARRTRFNPRLVHSGFSLVGIGPDDGTGRRASLGISLFPRRFIPALLHTHSTSLSSFKTSRPNIFAYFLSTHAAEYKKYGLKKLRKFLLPCNCVHFVMNSTWNTHKRSVVWATRTGEVAVGYLTAGDASMGPGGGCVSRYLGQFRWSVGFQPPSESLGSHTCQGEKHPVTVTDAAFNMRHVAVYSNASSREIWAVLNIVVLRADENGAVPECKGRGNNKSQRKPVSQHSSHVTMLSQKFDFIAQETGKDAAFSSSRCEKSVGRSIYVDQPSTDRHLPRNCAMRKEL